MSKQTTLLLVTTAIISITSILLLISGHQLLLHPLISEPYLPAGTIITWQIMISLPCIGLLLTYKRKTRFDTWLFYAFFVLMLIGIFWGLISYLLTGNWNYSASPTLENHQFRMSIFFRISYLLPTISLLLITFLGTLRLVKTFN